MKRAHKIVGRLLLVLLIVSQLSCQRAASDEKEAKGSDDKKAKGEAEKFTNRLAKETSPYLLLHAHNPVDWYPWGPEALEKAKKENKVIFLSVGYSSCHWCHVMERESFMDKKIAAFLNKHFICIKVDREERPDVDKIYMTAVQAYAGRGGWPMSVFMTPDAKPFFGGTYFPARDGDRGQATGFETLTQRVQEAWKDKEKLVRQDADRLTEYVKRQLEGQISLAKIKADQFGKVYDSLESQFDPQYGGFGYDRAVPQRPKFPEPSNLLFMLRFIDKEKDAERKKNATKMLTFSLDRMAMGGIWDHLGGGFHRYSVDRYWMIPHFEKMLYDNAQLATVYAEAYQLTGHQRYRRIVEEMLDFVIREMTDEKGGYYSALDAESEGEEGKFYRWKKEDVEKLLTKEEFSLFAKVYGLSEPPNFEEHYYAPQLGEPMADIAKSLSMSEEDLQKKLVPIRKKLFDVRAKRKRPLTDTKVLTAWNGLMIRGMADAGRILKEKRFTDSAIASAEFVWNSLRDDKGRLLRTYGGGKAKLNAYLVDYAFLIDGLIALHESTGDKKWLDRADQLMQIQLKQFKDERRGGFYFTSEDHESLLSRQKNPVDSAQPSGNSISAMNLIYLGEKLKKPEYIEEARKAVNSVASLLERIPALAPRTSVAASMLIAKYPEPESKEPESKEEKSEGKEDAVAQPVVEKKDAAKKGTTEKPNAGKQEGVGAKLDANGKPIPTPDKGLEDK